MVALRRQIPARINGIEDAALVEPIDRAPNAAPLSGITRIASGEDWLLLLKGDAADFACMDPLPQLVLVYGAAGEEARQRRSPDFRLIEMPRLVLSSEKTRGFVGWSSGWTGGTILFWREGEGWRFEAISQWIT